MTGTGRNPDRYPPDEKAVSWRDIESTAEQVRAEGTRALPLIVDVADATSVQQMVERTIAEFGRIDILVNNAAYARGPDRVPITELQQDIFQRVLDVKITGTYLCTKAVIEPMIAQGGGKIVNISSGSGKTSSANNLAYTAACFAQVGMTQSMAHELGPHNINVNCICPGAVDTSRVRRCWQGRSVAVDSRQPAHPQDRHRRRSWRIRRLSMHRIRILDSRPVHQHRRRRHDGPLAKGCFCWVVRSPFPSMGEG